MASSRGQIRYLLKPDAVLSIFANGKVGNKTESSNIVVKDTETIEFKKVKSELTNTFLFYFFS